MVRLVANLPGTTKVVPDSRFPAGSSFIVEFAPGDPSVTAIIEVWPRTEKACEVKVSPTHVKQYHRFAMSASGDGAARVLRATIPPLQIDQTFCYRLTPAKALIAVQLGPWTTEMNAGFMRSIAKVPVPTGVQDAIKKLRGDTPDVTGDFASFEKQFSDEMSRSATVSAYLIAEGVRDELAKHSPVDDKDKVAKKARAEAAASVTSSPPLCDSPTVIVGHKLDRVANIALADTSIDEAIAALKVRGKAADLKWVSVLGNVKGKAANVRDALIKAAVTSIKPQPIEVTVDEKTYFDLGAELVKLPAGSALDANLAKIVPQLQGLTGCSVQPALDGIDKIGKADQAVADAVAIVNTSIKDAKDAANALNDAIATAVRDASANLRVVISLEYESGGDVATAPVGTFVSPDLGMAIAAPLAGGARTPWLMPFFGVNFYFAKVDRDIPIKDLVGSRRAQLFSFTVGISLSSPGIDGRTVDSILFGEYPMVGFGWRLSEHVRASVGSFFYLLRKQDPTIATRTFGAAPFIALSIDTDVYHYIQKAYTEK